MRNAATYIQMPHLHFGLPMQMWQILFPTAMAGLILNSLTVWHLAQLSSAQHSAQLSSLCGVFVRNYGCERS